MSETQCCVGHRASAKANMELAIAEYEASISKMVCATLQIASERAQDVIEAARKKRKLNQVTEQEEVLKKNEVKDSDDEESEEEEQGTKEIPLGLVSFGGRHSMIINARR